MIQYKTSFIHDTFSTMGHILSALVKERDELAQPWQPMGTAPKDGLLDIWARLWVIADNRFVYRRVLDCRWSPSLEQWIALNGWTPIAWMRPPAAPPVSLEDGQ